MQILARAGEDFPFFSKLGPGRVASLAPSQSEGAPPQEQMTPSLAPLEFVSKATSVLRSASTRAKRALVELKDDIVHDIMTTDFSGASQQALSQGSGWALPWAVKTDGDRQREETTRRIRELAREPFRFLVPPLQPESSCPEEQSAAEESWTESAAAAAIEVDGCLRALRNELVPRMLPEREFWQRYFRAVREIESEAQQKYTEFNATRVHPSPEASPCNSSKVTESAESSAFTWSAPGSSRLVSSLRVVDVDTEPEVVEQPSTFRRSQTELGYSGPSGVSRCPSEAGRTVLAPSASFSDGSSRYKFIGDALGAALGRHLLSSTAEPAEGSERREEEDVEGPFSWLRRTVSGASSVSGVCLSDGGEGQLPQDQMSDGGGVTFICETPTKMGAETPPAVDIGAWPADGMPAAAALQHLNAAYLSAAGYSSFTELGGLDSSNLLNFVGSMVGGSFRRQSGGQRAQSPSRLSQWGPGDPSWEAPDIPRTPLHRALLDYLFRADRSSEGSAVDLSSMSEVPGRPIQCFQRVLHGAPAGSFVAELAFAMTRLPSAQGMALLWLDVVARLRWHFQCGVPIPGVEVATAHPDLQLCEIMQHLQLLNLCMERRRRRRQRLAEEVAKLKGEREGSERCRCAESIEREIQCRMRCARCGNCRGAVTLAGAGWDQMRRKGVKEATSGLFLLETGEPMLIPETQDTPLMTETAVRESEEMIIRTGAMGYGCNQLFSDMQAFKAANPGCILEDFVRWYSPPDWSSVPYSQAIPVATLGRVSAPELCGAEVQSICPGELEGAKNRKSEPADQEIQPLNGKQGPGCMGLSKRGYLSIRMTFAGNLWQELWKLAEPIPAIEQMPLFDVEEGGEGSLKWLQDVTPCDLLEQMFITLLSLGLSAAHALPDSAKEPLKTSLAESVRYIACVCSRGMGAQKQQMLCSVYEVLDTAKATTNLVPLFQKPQCLEDCDTPGPETPRLGSNEVRGLSVQEPLVHPVTASSSMPESVCLPQLDVSLHEESSSQNLSLEGQSLPEAAVEANLPQGSGSQMEIETQRGGDLSIAGTTESQVKESAGSAAGATGKDASAKLRQAASAFFQRMKTGPSWSKPSVVWPIPQGLRAIKSLQRMKDGDKEKADAPNTSGTPSSVLGTPDDIDSGMATPASCEDLSTCLSMNYTGSCVTISCSLPITECSSGSTEAGGTARDWDLDVATVRSVSCSSSAQCRTKEKELEGEWVIL